MQVIMECELDRAISLPSSEDIGLLDIENGDDSLLEAFVVRHLTAKHLKRFQAYLRCGYHGQLVTRKNEMIGCTWWVATGLPLECANPAVSRLGLRLEPGDAHFLGRFPGLAFPGPRLGRAFYGRHLAQLRARGVRRFYLWVDGKNQSALHLYRGLGFHEISRRRSILLASSVLFTTPHISSKTALSERHLSTIVASSRATPHPPRRCTSLHLTSSV